MGDWLCLTRPTGPGIGRLKTAPGRMQGLVTTLSVPETGFFEPCPKKKIEPLTCSRQRLDHA
jgi:hypothetical protein